MPATKEQIVEMMQKADWEYDLRDSKEDYDRGRRQQLVLRGALREMAVTDRPAAVHLWLEHAPKDWAMPEFLASQKVLDREYERGR